MTIDAMLERLHAAYGRVYLQWATAGFWACNAYDLGDADTNARHARGATPAEAVAGCFKLAFGEGADGA